MGLKASGQAAFAHFLTLELQFEKARTTVETDILSDARRVKPDPSRRSSSYFDAEVVPAHSTRTLLLNVFSLTYEGIIVFTVNYHSNASGQTMTCPRTNRRKIFTKKSGKQ